MVQINELSAQTRECIVSLKSLTAPQYAQNLNQITRWINTKEQHADKIISLVAGMHTASANCYAHTSHACLPLVTIELCKMSASTTRMV
jgi:hypothetical protein